ncbi:hypothetical protein [Vulgatibacter incomptus]|uniref:Protein RecA n=1 Tax=Vulgatibacter incomptus TaxID=1391653 RepID=A0A0K1PIP8_9BACT|nr:hypothetical protein [Vulgatibacter incomptus]AKU93266.1 RecA protein [Vulgatibacter incomptus]
MARSALELDRLVEDLRRTRALVTPQELAHRLPSVTPTGLEPLDRLLGGGLPEGRIVELVEERGAWGSSLALLVLARFTADGRSAALIDRADAFDPRGAVEAGVALDRLLWCRPSTDQEAIRAADVLLSSGAFPLVVLDLARGAEVARGGAAGRGGSAGQGSAQGSAGQGAAAERGGGADAGAGREDAERGAGSSGSGSAGGAGPLRLAPRSPGLGSPGLDRGLRFEPYAGYGAPRKDAPRRKAQPDVSQAAWLRLARDAEGARASLIVVGGTGAGGVSSACLRPVRRKARFLGNGPGRTFEGLDLTVALERNRLGLPLGEALLSFRAPSLFPAGLREPAPGQARTSPWSGS